jgi:NitT/TauT family transport system substrate-binding protein
MRKLIIGFTACLFLFGGLASQAKAAKTTFLLDWIVYGKHAPFFAAQDFGFYKKVGLDVKYVRGFGSGDTIKKVAARVAPIGFADASSLVNARANNPDIKVKVVAMGHAKTIMNAFFFKGKYQSPKDLAGARIGSPQANAVRVIFPAFAAANGLDVKSVKFINMTYAQVTPAMLTGQIDVALWFATEVPKQIEAAKKIGKEMAWFSYGDYGVKVYNNGIIVREETIQSKPDFVRNAVKANIEAWAWSMVNVDKAIGNFLKYAPGMSEHIVRGQFAIALEYFFDEGVRRHGLGYMDFDKMDKTVELLTKLQKLKSRVPTKDMFTNRFLPQWSEIKATLGDKVM